MSSDPIRTHIWYPTEHGGETLKQLEERVTKDWLRENLSPQAQKDWLRNASWYHPAMTPVEALCKICKHDSGELVELLYPRAPDLFRKARTYTLSSTLFSSIYEGPFTEEILQQCVQSRTGCLDAACLFALTGAAACLEQLLDYGSDPDGLEVPASWSYIELLNGQILPVSPMDCALLSGSEDCQMVLELYGGRTIHEHLANR